MKFVASLPFVILMVFSPLAGHERAAEAACRSGSTALCLAQAPTRPSSPPTQPEAPQSGNDTLKLASLGVVFLLIGAAVVYAPQIVAAISGFPRRLTGKPRKKAPPPAKAARPVAPRTEEVRMPAPVERPPLPPPVVVPIEAALRVAEPDDVVSRLQNEVRSAWSRTR